MGVALVSLCVSEEEGAERGFVMAVLHSIASVPTGTHVSRVSLRIYVTKNLLLFDVKPTLAALLGAFLFYGINNLHDGLYN